MRRFTETSQQQQQQVSSQQEIRQEQRTTQQRVVRQQVQGMVVQEGMIVQGYPSGTPPVFERVFSNARFAQGGDALFEGRVTGDPKPVISWTRKGAPLMASQKHQLRYEEQTGNVSLLISRIGPGDEGEYTCTARNQLGEAMCSVYIQPEGVAMPVQPQGLRRDTQVRQTQQQMTQMQQTQQSMQQMQTMQQQQQQTQQHMQTIQQRTQQSTYYANGFTTIEEDFKVDTFEYRLLREVSFRESLTRRYAGESDVSLSTALEQQLGPPAPPQVAAKPRNSKLQEGADAVFTAVVPGNPRPRLTWFKNGKRLVFSQKHQTAYSNQQAQLRISQVNSQDSGHYTMLAENPQGCVVTSAYLAVEPSAAYEQTIERETRQMIQIEREESVEGKMIAPNFARTCSDREVSESKMTRFDCRVTGRPYPEVTWYINGRQVVDDASHKILVNESGNHALMITNVSRADSGVVTCVARNKAGETSFECKLNVIEKELVVAPKFVQRFGAASIKEGEPVSLTARAVGTPIPNITWQKDGVPINSGNGINITTSGGGSTLEISGAKAQDAGWYQCMAQNMAGSTATRARVHVQKTVTQDVSQPSRLHLPTPTTIIQPEPAPEPEIIYLRHVERAAPRPARGEQDRVYPPPQFIIPLSDQAQVEGNRVHFEARVEPVGDPTMNIQWYHNGKVLPASSRITTTFRFGFIALDMLSIVPEDAGEYACVVASATGNAQSVAKLTVTGRVSIDQKSQYPESLQYITQLEDYSKYQRSESVEELSPVRPQFIRPLKDLGQLQEGRNAHFEAQLTPVSDPTMRVDWFKDGKPITASSRITTIFNFGYVSLNILHLRSEDTGVYTVRAVNRWGEAVSQSSVTVISRNSVTADLGIPEQQRYIDSVEALEAYTQQSHVRQTYEPPESTSPPVFQSQVQDQLNVKEGGFAHFEARLEPVGDSTLRVEWFKDGRPVEASSRITSFFNFGYVALTIKHVATHDMGRYTCRAYNTLGEATTSANLTVISKQDIISDSQHTSSLQKIQHLEDSSRYMRQVQEETAVTQKPRFLGPLKGTNRIVEGQRAHFEARVEPLSDTTMKIEWYFNGKVLQTANRIQTYHDFGYVALDIESVRAEDAGTYTVIARNALGEAQLQASMQVETRSGIDTRSMHHGAYDKTKHIEQHRHVEPTYNIEEISKSKPIFVTPLSDPPPANEGKNIHLECRLEPMGDPTMRVEWFQNGKPITIGSRFRTYHDFGYVALDIVHVTSMDSGEYTVRATNHLGSAHTSACVRVMSRSDILTDTQNENSLEQIQYLEDSKMRRHVQEDVTIMSAPVFTRPLHNIETLEGTNIHLECRLQPVGDPTMRVDWFVNGKPVRVGHRFRPAYDFNYVALDLLSVYPDDSGVYTCQARNQLGEAVTSCSVRIIAKKDLILESQHPGGLEKIQYLEDASRYKRTDQVEENVTIRPRFITKPKSIDAMREGGHAHFECKLEPVTDSNLKVEWYKNGRPIIVGHRFRPIHDFGYVALDIIDVIEEDSGTYTCRATNMLGYDETSCSLKAKSTSQIITATQNEMGLEQIQYLEDRSRYQRHSEIEETTTQAPVFTSSLKHCEIKEGQRAHFECRLIPVSDNSMKVEWFHNGQPVKSGSRFTETNNFGFVALDILHCLPEDSGTYTCRARNINGEAVTSSTLNVSSRKSIYLESQHQSALSRLNQFEDRQYQKPSGPEETATQAPVFTQPMRDLRTTENQTAHFEARLIPVGDPRLKVEWLRNGVPIAASNRVSTMHDFGYVALNMKYVYAEDSGTYTCRAKNDLGEAVTSATMTVQSKASLLTESQHEAALQKLQALEDSTKYHRTEEQDIVVNQKPNFTAKLNGPSQLVEGQSAHYECRIEPYPDPNLKVEWLHNGQPLQTGHRFRTTYDFGFAALDILTVYEEDTGEYTCRATNKLGQAVSSVNLKVQGRSGIIRDTQHKEALQKIQYLESDARYKRIAEEEAAVTEKPQFGRPLKNVEHLPEGKQAHLEATLTPVNDPTMKVEWFRNGRPIPQGHRFKTVYDFGFVALDVLYAYAEDSGTYMCKARNAAGEAVTTCSITVDSKAGLQLDTLDEQRLKKIRELEHYERPQPQEVEAEQQKPVFLTPLNSLENLKEGEHAHLECRVEPINDPHMKIEWFVNGKAIKTGHRFRTTHDFGYVALDILYTYAEDSGTYMCKATNKMGEAVNTCNIKVQSRHSILLETQHPEGLEKIRELEAQGHPQRLEIEEPLPTPPRFVTELRGTKEIAEGQTSHFEAQIEPLHDPNLRIEIYHNGKPLGSASRYHITFDFGYFALDIGHCLPSDAGEYTVKAINKLGSCVSSTSMQVVEKGSIISESQRPEGLEKIKQLEAGPQPRPEVPEAITRQRPVFTQSLANIDGIAEGQNAHFECRLIPVGDPTLKVEWFRNEKLLEDSSRITKTHDFGYVSMDMTHVREDDEGVYMCRASNALGEAVTTASMKIKSKASIQRDTQHPEGMKKIQQLEEGKEPARRDEPDQVFEKPIFTNLLTGPSELWEGQRAHFEARVVPVGDPTMRYLWYCNGVELKMGSRFHTTNDFGFVTLDIMATVPEDSGIYMCKAINAAGEAVSSTTLKVKPRSAISGEPLQPDAWQKIQLKEAEMNKVPEGFQEVTPQMPPVFTKHLSNAENLVEGSHVYLEALVEPKADPNLKIEWFKNGKSITTGARIRSTFDFGLVTLSVNGVRPDDSAIYTCKATNLLGEAVSTCTIKVEDRHWLLANSLRPEALPLIDALEGPKEAKGELPEPAFEGPVFISHLNNVVCTEGENSHFECRVEPAKDPTLNIEFFANGKPLPSGARFKGNHDFGFVTLDINSCYSNDSGIYTVKATNSKGQASTSGTLKCTGKSDIYLQTQHPQGQAGLEKVQEVDDAYASKLQRQDSKPEAQYPKPVWTTPLTPEFKLGEAQPLHLEATVEPKEDPNLKIEWYFNGKALEHGSRFKMTSEFGFVTLDLIEVYERDQGIYTCKAWNKSGEAFTTTTIYCSTKAGLIEKTQHPKGQEGLGKIQELEESLRREDAKKDEAEEGQAPVFTSQFQDISNLGEGEIAHFEASLTPVGDQSMRVEWFFNGKTIEASHRIRTVHAFGMVVLEILGTKIEDSGVYTCRATNKWGQAEISVNLECVDITKGQKPKFTTQIKSVSGLKDGDSVHFECTLIPVGDPSMKVEWFHNGRPIRHSTRIKQVSDFGFVLMDIAYTQSHDTGEYVCRAKNKYGEDFTRAHVECVGKGGVYYDTLQPDSLQKIRELESMAGQQAAAPPTPVTEPPKFITQISDVTTLKEGQSAHFEARLTPVNDPNLVVEWFYNGKKLPHGHRYRTFHDFGIVILDILYCYAENTGEYECRATNLVGTDSTKAVLKCSSKANLILTSQLPEGMEGGLEKIQTLEESMIKTRDEQVSETKGQAPVFTVPLSNIDSLREGENAHFEARLTPTDDPKLKVEWFWNNKPLRTGARFRTFCDFGFVILEISPVYPEDSGEYSCRASNEYGQAVTTSVMKVEGKRSIIIESQLPKGMEGTIDKIAELEGLGQLRPPVLPEDDLGKPPEFITQPADLTLVEYSLAHFECRLTPINDPSLRVEWFHNGKPLTAGSRFKTINDFGFVILEISGVDTRDAGLYTCKATNNHGEAVVSCKLQVRGRQGIIMEPQLPNTFSSGTESIQKLEEDLHKKDEVMETEEKPNPPRFIVDLRDFEAQEAGKAHFDCRVEPVGDPTLRIDWFFNGRPFATGSRVHMINDFGFVVLDMEYVYTRDAGEYLCRATNKWGTATSKAKLTCKAKHDVVLDSQLPSGMSGEKLRELERGKVTEPKPEVAAPAVPPKFITHITSASVGESEPVRFECKVEPKNDETLKIEWYRNGKILPMGHRYKTVFDMGFVSLDILYVYPEDSGDYVCRAYNAYGEDFTKATISCKKIPSIILQNQVPRGMKKSETLMQMEATIKKYTSEVHLTEEDLYEPEKKQPPRFVTQIKDQTELVEMEATKFECQLAPVGDPNMKVEWFYNGKPLHHKNRFTPIYDFGYVAMNFGWVYPEDSGEYLCRATNLYGMDETRAIIKTAGKPGIIYDSQLPKGMKSIEKIRELESSMYLTSEEKVEEEKEREAPVFVSKPEPCTVQEGDCARFCCRVTGYPRPRVVWLINDHTVVNGARCKLTYDGMWHLDIPKTRQYDTGTVAVVARNSSGEQRVETQLSVTPRGDDYRGVLKNSPRQIMGTSLYKKPEWVTHMEEMQEKIKATQAEPTFVKEITDSHVKTEETVVFDAMYAGNPQPVIIWYHDDKLLRASENVEISIKDNRSTVVIKRVKPENAGTYTCKASSNIGEAISRAKVNIIGYGEVQEEEVQEIREETVVEKKEKKKKKRVKKVVTEEIERDSVDIEEIQPLESTAPFTETTETATAQRTFDIQESVAVSAVASCKKVSDEQEFPTDVPDVAGIVAPIQESVTITETIPGDEVVEMTVSKETTETASVTRSEQKSVSVSQTVTESSVSELITETRTETRATESVEVLQTAQASRTTVSVSDIEETLEGLNVKEFGPWQAPLRELAKVDVLRKKGVSVEEVLTLYDTGELPALKTAPAQNALVSLVERVGHSSLISEMVTQEETLEDTLKGVLKAFLKMVELRHATVQETIALFRPRDFQTPHWETVSTMPVIAEETATETITETSQVEVQEMRTITQKKTKKVEHVVEGEAIAIEEVQTDEGEVPESQLTEPIIEEPAEKEDLKPAKKKKSVKKKAVKPEESKPEPTPPTEEAQPLDKPKESKPEEIKPEEIKQKKAATKLQPMKIERKTMEPQKPQFAVAKEEEAPLFTSVKLRKSSVAPRKEAEPVKAPTFLLKSRIKRIEYPPKLHYLTITQLEPVEVDRGILSRNYEEAQKIKKKKVKKIKLSEIETAEKEEYIPYEEEKPDKVSETPETKSIKLPKEKPVEEVEEPIKIKIGKGQVPQEEVLEEKVALKKQPKKPEDVPEEVAKVPKKPKPEEPLKPTEPDEASFKLKPVKPIETGEPDDLEQPKETVPEEEKEKIVEPVKKKTPKVKTPKEEEKPEEKSFPLGKGKKPEEEAEPEIQLRKKQGSPAKEVPEPIKLKPFEKEKPTPEEPEKKLTGPKPEPSDIARPEEEIKPKEFDIDDKQKKKKKVKKPEKDNEVPEPIEKPQEIVEPEKPRMKLQRLEKVEVKFDKPKLLTAVIGVVEGPFSVKLRRIKVEKVGEEPNVLEQFLLKSRIQRNKYPPAPQTLTVTDLTPPVRGNGVISRNYEEAQEELRKRPSKKKLPKKPKPELETLDIPELEKKPKEESAVEETVRHPSKKETPAEEDVEPTKIVLGKGKIPKDEPEAEVVKLKKIAPKPEDKQLEEKKPKKVESQISDKEKPERKYSDTPLRPVEDLEFPEAPVEEHLEPETPKEIEEQEKEESPKKKPKEKKPKPEEHEEPRPFELGKGKKPEPEPQDEVKFRIPEKPKEPEEPEGITLKPFKKDSSEKPQEEPETEFEGKLPKKEKKGVKDSDKTKKVKKKKTPSEDKPVSPEKEMSPEKLPMPEKEESPRPEKKIEEKQVEKEKPKLVAIKIERKEIKATKMKVEELKPEQPLFTTVKLRKSSVTPKADKPKTDEPKRFLLKSRITHVRYPPEMQFPVFSTLPKAEVDCGILSRNYKEAEKLPKKKVKKIKLTEKEETQLEEYEPYQEEPESPKQEEPEKVVKPRERPGKKLSKDEEPEKLVLGKGTIPKEEEKPEEVKLRKVKPKEEEEVPLEEKPKKKPEEELVTKKKPKEEKSLDKLEPLKDLPGDGERVELEKPEKLPEIEKEKAPKEEEPVKRKSLKKKKPEPEEPAGFPLGKGKPRPEEEPEEITFRKPTPKDEETPSEEIKLKPFKKEKPEIEDEPSPEVKLTIGKPAEKPVEEELETVSIKKKKPKKKETSPEEETVSVVMKPKKVEDVPAEAEVVRLRKPSKPEDQEVEEQIVLMRKKPEKKVIEEVESDFTIKKIEQTYTEEEAFDNVTIKKKAPKKPYVMEEEAAEITIQKEEPVKKPELEDTMVLKMTFKEQPKEEEEVATAVIKPRRKVSEDVTEEVTVKKEKKKSISGETVSGDAVTVKKITKAKKKYSISEEAGELTIQKTEEVQEEVPAVSFRKPSKPKISEEELPAQAITLKKPKKPLVEEPEIVESVTFAPKVVKHKEDIEQEFSIKMGSYEEEEVEMSGKVKLPRKKKPSFAEEASSETIYIEQEVETPYSVEEGPEENVQIGLRRPKPKTIQKEEVEQEFKIKMGSYEEEEVEMSGKVRLPKKKKPVSFAEEADSETIYIEQEVEEGPADVKFPLRRKSSTTPYSIEEVEEEVQLGLRKPRKESIVYEEESLELKVKRKPSKPTIQSFHQEEASLHITKVVEEPSELRIVEATEGSPLFSICSYIAETDDALSLVEGEKVYVIESNNSDWWFVKKHLTEEKGWVPAVYLRDEPSYTLYVQKKLHEKIDKLPIFEKPGPGANVFAPKFVEKLQPKRVSDGGVVQFECKVEGNPRPQITWFRQTAIIKPSHDFQIFYDDDNVATLIISEIFPEDAGTFTCVAKNAAGFASSTTELIVESPLSDHGSDTTGLSRRSLSRESSLADILEGIPPTFSRKPKAKVVSPGSDVELEVRLVAIPEPEIHWFLKNKPVTPSANVTITTQSDMHMYANTMKISKVSRGQEGTYTVVAKNREGEASVDIILKIKTGEPEPPVVVDLVKDVTVTEGEGIVLTAQVAGVPTPKVVWLKDGRPVKLESTAVGDTHTAIVRNSKPSDAGKYTLEATNSQGKASSTANVTVQGHTDALHKGDSSSRDESKQSQDGSSGSSACTVVDLHVSDIKSEAKYSETRTKEFSSVKTTEFASMESLQTLTHESHVQEVVGVVSKITQKIDRLENTIDDLVKRLSRPTESSSRSSNITISDFETSESESRAEVSEKSISESKTLTESSTGFKSSLKTLTRQRSAKEEKERVVMTKDDFVEKVKSIGNQLRSRLQPDRYIKRVKQQCDQYVHELEVMDVVAGPKKPRASVPATTRASQGTRE